LGYINECKPSHLHFGIHPGHDLPANPWRGYTYDSGNTYGWVNPVNFLLSNSPLGEQIVRQEFSIQQHLLKSVPSEKEAHLITHRFTKVANVSCDELSRLGTAIGQVLQRELNSPEMRRLAVMRALNLADEAINTGNL